MGSLAEIDPRRVAEVVRRSRHKKTTPLRPIFRALSETHSTISLETCKALFSGLNPTCQVQFIQIHRSFRDLLAKTTFQIVTIIGDAIDIGSPIKIITSRILTALRTYEENTNI